MHNYIVKVNRNTNKIMEVHLAESNLEECLLKCKHMNESLCEETEFRYLPIPNTDKEPIVGMDASDEMRKKTKNAIPSIEKMGNTNKNIDEALKLIIATDMTITTTGITPLKDISVDKIHESLMITGAILLSLQKMNQNVMKERREQKDVVNDLFEQLGLNTQKEEE